MEDEKKHALLSASSSHRWLVCTPSARLEEPIKGSTSTYMEEGTLAHAMAELKVTRYFLDAGPKSTFTKKLNNIKKQELYKKEMDDHTNVYLEYLKEETLKSQKKTFIVVEHQVDYSTYAPEGFGTADCIMINEGTLSIIDFKYGQGVQVSAEENPQLKLYALGALEEYKLFYDIKTVKLVIIQPRLDNISEYSLSVESLLEWANTVVKPQAEKAFLGVGEFVKGEHCRFCKVKGNCKFRATEFMKVVNEVKDINSTLLSNQELAEILVKTEGIEQWIKDTQDYALTELLKGNSVPGWKAVEGKSNRLISDVDKAFDVLRSNGYDEAILFERKPITLTQLEEAIGKKNVSDIIGNYIEKPKGAPKLAKESDKREAYKRNSAIDDFKPNIKEEGEN